MFIIIAIYYVNLFSNSWYFLSIVLIIGFLHHWIIAPWCKDVFGHLQIFLDG